MQGSLGMSNGGAFSAISCVLVARLLCSCCWTTADGVVIDHGTAGRETAAAWTRVGTLEVHTGKRQWTLAVTRTLRSTHRRTAEVAAQTGANGLPVDFATLAVRGAWCGVSRIRSDRGFLWFGLCRCVSCCYTGTGCCRSMGT
uniref:Putative secreted protein n=1 Tax=Anopheles darlingi TaxID=43151 RepID=A0A2M4D799_ANODA